LMSSIVYASSLMGLGFLWVMLLSRTCENGHSRDIWNKVCIFVVACCRDSSFKAKRFMRMRRIRVLRPQHLTGIMKSADDLSPFPKCLIRNSNFPFYTVSTASPVPQLTNFFTSTLRHDKTTSQ